MDEAKPRRRRRKHTEVRELLLTSARELFAERGYGNTTTRDIAKRAGASEVLLYRYFNTKAQLFEQAISEPFDEIMRVIIERRAQARLNERDVAAQGRNYVEALYRLLLDERQLILSLITTRAYEGGAGEPIERPRGLQHYFAEAEASLRAMYQRADAAPELDPALGARISFAAVVAAALLQDWLFADVAEPEAVAAAMARFVTHGLFGRD
jgi:AcrR family transcriptional regulator